MKVEYELKKGKIIRTQIIDGESDYGKFESNQVYTFTEKAVAEQALKDLTKQLIDLEKQAQQCKAIIKRNGSFDDKYVEKVVVKLEELNKLINTSKNKKKQVELFKDIVPFLKDYRELVGAKLQLKNVEELIPIATQDCSQMQMAIKNVFK